MYKQPKKQHLQTTFDTSRLVSDEDTCHAYLLALNTRINSMPSSLDPYARVMKCIKDAATDIVGTAPFHAHRRYTQDSLVAELSAE